MEHRQRGGLHEAVESEAEEADMVAAADIVDARLPGLRQKVPGHGRVPAGQQGDRREHANSGGRGAGGWRGVSHTLTLGPPRPAQQSGDLPGIAPVPGQDGAAR